MIKISVIINTLNEEKNISRAINSVKEIADEIVVVDMNSEDKTQSVAKKLGAKVFTHKKTNYVEPARNFAISKASGAWILILDADEEISQNLSRKLKKLVKENKADYYRLPRKNIVFGKWLKHSRWWPDLNIRFFKKGKVSWNEIIHSVPMTVGTGLDLPAKEKFAIIHHHYETIDQYLERMNRYTNIQAELKLKEGYKYHWEDMIRKPAGEFMSRFFLGQGYKDGVHGLVLSLLQAFSEMVLYNKLWQKEKFKADVIKPTQFVEAIKNIQNELNYWNADLIYKEEGGIVQQIKRKLKLS